MVVVSSFMSMTTAMYKLFFIVSPPPAIRFRGCAVYIISRRVCQVHCVHALRYDTVMVHNFYVYLGG